MFVFVFRRIMLFFPVLFGVLVGTFAFVHYGPGDPLSVILGEEVPENDPAILARLQKIYGLDRPFLVQFGDYVCGGLCVPDARNGGIITGDFGKSLRSQRDIADIIQASLPISAQLGLASFIILYTVGVPLGILAAVKQNTWIDYWIVAGSIAVNSVPIFVLGPMVMIVVVLKLQIMDTPVGWEGLFTTNSILPVALMSLGGMLGVVRMTRAGILEIIRQGYVRTARAKGLRERMVISRHIMRNAMTPVLTGFGPTLAGFLTGAFLVELVFGIPGFSNAFITAFQGRDFPMILAGTMLGTAMWVVSNLVVDLMYGALDPRVRYE